MNNESNSFTDLGINDAFTETLASLTITKPTAVQNRVIPALHEGKNVLFQSETGTGKTFAYLLPLLQKIDTSKKDTSILIVAPTHELASQIKAQIQSISSIKTALCIGGASIKRQVETLKEKPLVVIGGPVRLIELIHLKKLKIANLTSAVFDEADRLLAPEMRDDTIALVGMIPKEAQIAACSATMKKSLSDALHLAAARDMESIELPLEDVLKKKITHIALFAEQRDKIDTLRSFLAAEKPQKALVFTSKLDQVSLIVSRLQAKQVDCQGLHAKSDKVERKQAIDRFKSGKLPILVTSDLSSRGLDITDITHIIQMDVPSNDDFFIHRAGRTARAGKEGFNVIIGDGWELRQLAKLEKKLGFIVYPKQLSSGKLLDPVY
jgi:superfamily II DNA/RNA helicase